MNVMWSVIGCPSSPVCWPRYSNAVTTWAGFGVHLEPEFAGFSGLSK